jgi:hypothetical protein
MRTMPRARGGDCARVLQSALEDYEVVPRLHRQRLVRYQRLRATRLHGHVLVERGYAGAAPTLRAHVMLVRPKPRREMPAAALARKPPEVDEVERATPIVGEHHRIPAGNKGAVLGHAGERTQQLPIRRDV